MQKQIRKQLDHAQEQARFYWRIVGKPAAAALGVFFVIVAIAAIYGR